MNLPESRRQRREKLLGAGGMLSGKNRGKIGKNRVFLMPFSAFWSGFYAFMKRKY